MTRHADNAWAWASLLVAILSLLLALPASGLPMCDGVEMPAVDPSAIQISWKGRLLEGEELVALVELVREEISGDGQTAIGWREVDLRGWPTAKMEALAELKPGSSPRWQGLSIQVLTPPEWAITELCRLRAIEEGFWDGYCPPTLDSLPVLVEFFRDVRDRYPGATLEIFNEIEDDAGFWRGSLPLYVEVAVAILEALWSDNAQVDGPPLPEVRVLNPPAHYWADPRNPWTAEERSYALCEICRRLSQDDPPVCPSWVKTATHGYWNAEDDTSIRDGMAAYVAIAEDCGFDPGDVWNDEAGHLEHVTRPPEEFNDWPPEKKALEMRRIIACNFVGGASAVAKFLVIDYMGAELGAVRDGELTAAGQALGAVVRELELAQDPDLLFASGFESGDPLEWDQVEP